MLVGLFRCDSRSVYLALLIVDGGVGEHVFGLPGIRLVARLFTCVSRSLCALQGLQGFAYVTYLFVPTIIRDPTYWCLFKHIKTCSERGIVKEGS